MQPIKVYLDSSDYSHLSDPKADDTQLETLEKLKKHITSKNIICYYSGIHLSEMAPIGQENYKNADRRISLLYELCGPNALISQDRIISGEIAHALERSPIFQEAHSNQGEWYPFDLEELAPSQINLETALEQEIASAIPDKQQAALALAYIKKNPQLLKDYLAKLKNTPLTEAVKNLTKEYPMNESDALVMAKYILGHETAERAAAALKNSLQNTVWIFSWLKQNPKNLEALSKWTRTPAGIILEKIKNADTILSISRKHEPKETEQQLSKKAWDTRTDKLLERIATEHANTLPSTPKGSYEIPAATIKEKCPGLTTSVSSLYSAWRSSLLPNSRPAKPSDFQDGLHSTYAPYVDIFRADSFMAPHIKKFTEKYGTKIIPKLKGIIATIETEVERRGKILNTNTTHE